MLATGLLKNCELHKTYGRVTMSAEAKFLTVSMATFRDKRYTAFFSMFLQLPTSEAKVDTLILTAHTHCFKLKRNLLTGKLPDIKEF